MLLFAIAERAQSDGLLDGPWVRGIDSWHRHILHFVAGLGFVHLLSPLLSSGSDINGQDIDGRTPLHYRLEVGWNQIICSQFETL